MLRFLTAALLSGCLLLAAPPSVETGETPAGSAARVEVVLEELRRNSEEGRFNGQIYRLTEQELNAYLLHQLARQPSPAVKALSLSLREGGLQVRAEVDPERLDPAGGSLTGGVLNWLLGGDPVLEVDGQLEARQGKGTFRMETARLNGMPLPGPLVEKLLETVSRQQDLPLDLSESFELPWGLQSITCQPGSVILQTRPKEP